MHSVMVLYIRYLHGIRVKQLRKYNIIYNSIIAFCIYINSKHFNNFDIIVMLGQINVDIEVLL